MDQSQRTSPPAVLFSFIETDLSFLAQYRQMGWQLASATAIMAWTAVVTYILLFIVDHIPGLSLRANEEAEIVGIDEAECGELGYDYVSLRRDLDDNHVDHNSGLTHVESRHSSNVEKKAHANYQTNDVTETSAREGAAAPGPKLD